MEWSAIFKWLFLGYGCLLLFLTLCTWIFASVITRNIGYSLKWASWFVFDITFQVLSRLVFNLLAAMVVNRQWDLRIAWVKKFWQTPDSKTNGGGINGDRSYSGEYGGTGGDQGFYDKWRIISDWSEKYLGAVGQYLVRVLITWFWFQRNCSHGFSAFVTGLPREKIHHVDRVESGDMIRILAYSESGKLVGFEYKNKGYLAGRGDCRIGHKIDTWQHWYPASFVYRVRPLKVI